ncbi:hypothetical protein KYLE_39 [Pantoea phage Kyle]|uniref:Uncharacterized protein n=1 Tax=Pantoea phage Kyle TaxID=2589665 RepID=A0A514A8J7_9CAUD|nr:hypothetical protein HWC52_gp039 [Pantoea phage Kyle]QDH49587.1 hypothetical protein KYLE_39 [Pantoea phage Kyle]
MKDVDLIDAIATRCEEGLAALGYNTRNFPLLQSYQPRQQGVPTGNSVYVEKLYSHVYGSPSLGLKYDSNKDVFIEKEGQIYNTTFQISVLLPQIPGNTDIPTAADVAEHLQRWISSRASLRIFRSKGLSIYRILDVKNRKFQDDQEQHEAFPSFDVTFNHINSLESEIGAVKRVVGRIIGV